MVACQVPSGQRKWRCLPACQSFPCMSLQMWILENSYHSFIVVGWRVMEYQICSTIALGKKPQWASRKESTVFGWTFTGHHDNLLDTVFLCPMSHRNRRSWGTWAELRDLWDVQVWHWVIDILARAWCQTRIRELRMALFPGGPFLSQTKSNKKCAVNCGSAIFARVSVTRKSQRKEFV